MRPVIIGSARSAGSVCKDGGARCQGRPAEATCFCSDGTQGNCAGKPSTACCK